MSNWDNVPVKISENYKPPPRIYQLPQAIVNRLMLQPEHYQQSPQYSYDFQLERKVLAKVPEWRRMRQAEKAARELRREQREQQDLRDLEAKHKQMLGAVNYPSAEDLLSSSSDDGETAEHEHVISSTAIENTKQKDALVEAATNAQSNSFHNILQPTILARSEAISKHARKPSNSFNYRDFEEDTSSPFDTIELKTINDLDILAQVLHSTQLKLQQENAVTAAADEERKHEETTECSPEASDVAYATADSAATKLLEENIPNETAMLPQTSHYPYQHATLTKHALPTYLPYQQQQQQKQVYNNTEQQQQYSNNYNINHQCDNVIYNQNFLYKPLSNGIKQNDATNFVAQNANNYDVANKQTAHALNTTTKQFLAINAESENNCKAKSVPDILKELSEEVRHAEMRRTRNYSCNMDAEKDAQNSIQNDSKETTANHTCSKNSRRKRETLQHFAKLEASTQQLAKNISSMGFPLERVAKIADMFGADDKKIFEHLIPLSELIDLGFDEMKISEALMKFDNNKEKALEYLIT